MYGDVHEADYLAGGVDYTTGADVTPAMKNSLMYKLCYYRFAEVRRLVCGQGMHFVVQK